VRRLHDLAHKFAAEVAPEQALARARKAREGRRVSVRPTADGMADLYAHLPVEQAVACYAALNRAATDVFVGAEPVTRSRSQIMADTLVERVTGQATARDVNFDVQVVMPLETLIDPGCPVPAEIPGHGPLPADLARELLARSAGRKAWRRMVTRRGVIIGGDSRRRVFSGFLADLIRARDGNRCTEPYCDAPIRRLDHIKRWSQGGPTRFSNGRGLCEFHDLVRETGGWTAAVVSDDPREVVTTTPTGHMYTSTTAKFEAPTRRRRRRAGPVSASRCRAPAQSRSTS
jgi:hypothetical protein